MKMPSDVEVEAALNAEIEKELQAERDRRRAEIAAKLRHKAAMEHLDRVNAKHPIENQYAGLTREQHEARQKAMLEGSRLANEKMDRANSRSVEGDLLHQRRASIGPGGEGFKFKPAGR
jgi:hypothetical protein